MHLVTDSNTDMAPEQLIGGVKIHVVSHLIMLEGETYRSTDLDPAEFYDMLEATDAMPTTSQARPGDFAEMFRMLSSASRLAEDSTLAATDPEILVILTSSGLSGAVQSARAGAEMVPEARVTIVDSKTLSSALGWQVEAASRALRAGWPLSEVLDLVQKVRDATDAIYTASDLTYLMHGGRISHLKRLMVSMLDIKPVIGVEKEGGTYVQRGKARTFRRALHTIADVVAEQYGEGAALRVQAVHGNNPTGVALLRAEFDTRFACTWLPTRETCPGLAAHSGPTMVGLIYAPLAAYPELP
jgi:DegV family protein with EDD domain